MTTDAEQKDTKANALTFPNVFSVDLEDWYQGVEIDIDNWGQFSPRIREGVDPLLDLLDEFSTRATFFVLGYQAEKTPALVRDITERGHEIASHGYSHRFVYRQSPAQFRSELQKATGIISDISGTHVVGFRAPYFSITQASQWALDILLEEGFRYDSSVFPVRNYRYGIPGAATDPGWIRTQQGNRLFEVPLSTVCLPGARGINLPLSGGGYFRLYPYGLTRALTKQLHRAGKGLIFYVHPWEYDPAHPRINFPRRLPRFTHYHNLASTADKTRQLLRDFKFATMEQAFSGIYNAGIGNAA